MEALLEREEQVENWNDERLDELSRRMDAGFEKAATKEEMNLRFDEVNGRFDRFEATVKTQFARIDERFARIDERFDRIDDRFDRIDDNLGRLNHTLLVGAFGLIAAVIANGIWG